LDLLHRCVAFANVLAWYRLEDSFYLPQAVSGLGVSLRKPVYLRRGLLDKEVNLNNALKGISTSLVIGEKNDEVDHPLPMDIPFFLTGNNAESNSNRGIGLYVSCNYNTLTNNIANSNTKYGIRVSSSSNYNTLSRNTAN